MNGSIWVELFATLGFVKGLALLVICLGFAELKRARRRRCQRKQDRAQLTSALARCREQLAEAGRHLRQEKN